MLIQEAMRSHRPFKRKIWDIYAECEIFVTWKDSGMPISLNVADIEADDWEIKEEMQDVHISIKPHRWWTDFNFGSDVLSIPLQRHKLEEIKSLKDIKIHVVIDGRKLK
jgi:hypothetical protein